MSFEHIYRVTVRGRFDALDEMSRARLVRERPKALTKQVNSVSAKPKSFFARSDMDLRS